MSCKLSLKHNLQAVGLPSLDEAPGPRPRDMPDPDCERPSYMKRRARQLLFKAADAAPNGDQEWGARHIRLRRIITSVEHDLDGVLHAIDHYGFRHALEAL